MVFTISAVAAVGPVSSVQTTSKDALDKLLEFEKLGWEQIVVRDQGGRIISTDELAALYTVSEDQQPT